MDHSRGLVLNSTQAPGVHFQHRDQALKRLLIPIAVPKMSDKGTKRARTDQPGAVATAQAMLPGRDQLFLTSPELQARHGKKYCDEAELLPLLLAHGLVRRVRTIDVSVHPIGGDNFNVTLDAALPTVGEAKAEIARVQGTEESRQELYKVAVRADGGAVREDDAEVELLDADSRFLGDGEVVAMAVKELPPLEWRTFAEDRVQLSEDGAVATQTDLGCTLTTTGVELTEGKHYWEVEPLSKNFGICIGISRPNLNPKGCYLGVDCTDGWFMYTYQGALLGNGKYYSDAAGRYNQGDRVGVLLDLDDGSLRFFKNGVQHGPGYAAGSVAGPVVAAVQMFTTGESVRLLPNVKLPRQ
jgi:hypothetical protein